MQACISTFIIQKTVDMFSEYIEKIPGDCIAGRRRGKMTSLQFFLRVIKNKVGCTTEKSPSVLSKDISSRKISRSPNFAILAI